MVSKKTTFEFEFLSFRAVKIPNLAGSPTIGAKRPDRGNNTAILSPSENLNRALAGTLAGATLSGVASSDELAASLSTLIPICFRTCVRDAWKKVFYRRL